MYVLYMFVKVCVTISVELTVVKKNASKKYVGTGGDKISTFFMPIM